VGRREYGDVNDPVARPGYWDIVIAYLKEGHRAWRERDVASGVEVERRLGLSQMEGHSFVKYLEGMELIEYEPFMNALGAYHLLPKGLAVAVGLPSLDLLLATQASVVPAAKGPAEAEKKTALATLRDATMRYAIEQGVGWVLKNSTQLLRMARTRWPWIPDLGVEDIPR
jgi:hypothetical protein